MTILDAARQELSAGIHSQALRPGGDGMADGELLARFVRSRDEDALAALVRRHAPMVWGVCRRLLNHHDAEDAFQATFLVLVRKAADVRGQTVANWLYGVARQTAVRLRATAGKRGRRETQVVNMPEPTMPEARDTDLQRVVDEELSRLPDHYRGVVVLCDLEGMTRKEAARQLGIPEGSVASRLSRARTLLAKRLAQRGVVFSGSAAAVLSAGSASASAPPALVASTIKVANLLAAGQAAGVVSVKVAAITEGVVKAMFMTKTKSVLAVMLVVAALAGVAGLIYQTQAAEPPKDSNRVGQAPAPATPAGKTSPKNAKKEPDMLTPEEAIEQRSKEKRTVRFKVTKVIVQPLEGPQSVGYNEGPYIRLIYGKDFSVLLRGPASYHIERLGIDPAKHFSGKSVRVTGRVLPDPVQIIRFDNGPPTVVENDKGPPYQIVVDNLDQFEVVNE
jgi:RNA polymerase sigma factor (sigma-70 family)